MKKSIFALFASTMLVAASMFSGCQSSEKNVDEAQNDVTEANEALDKANKEYLADVEKYRKEKADMIAANEQSIVGLKVKIANEKTDVKAGYEKKITELEQKNRDLKLKMDDYKDEGKEKWESFKREFNHDMEALGSALKDFTVDNKK